MIKLIVFFIVGYLLLRVLKSWIQGARPSERVSRRTAGEVDDVMVKDPYCQAYFPERRGVPLEIGGQRLLFCSPECRDRYLRQHRADKP
jgi:hypothetical protein